MLHARVVVETDDGAVDTITLDETARHRRRIRMVSDGGIAFMLDLPAARLLSHGQGLVLDDGRIIAIRAEPEALYRVTGFGPRHLLTLAWQIGNRHLAAQVDEESLLIRRDPVIRTMLEGLGAHITEVTEPFSPLGGAYDEHMHAHNHKHHE